MNLTERKDSHLQYWYHSFKNYRLTFEGISSFLYHKRHRALNKAIKQINERQNIEHSRIYHLEHRMHNLTSLKERLFVGGVNEWLKQQLAHYNDEHSYSITTFLFLRTINEKCVRMYEIYKWA